MTIITDLPDILVQDLERKWKEFKQASAANKIDLPKDRQIKKALQRVFAFSDFVAKNCTRSPSLLSDLICSGDLQRRYSKNDYDQTLKKALVDVKDEAALIHILRTYRCREMTRIAFRDLAGWNHLSETVTDLSNLADACLEQATSVLYGWLAQKLGTPIAADGDRQQLVILGLGKLGAQELNFSSCRSHIHLPKSRSYTRCGSIGQHR